MKRTKRLASLLLAIVLVFALATTALAATVSNGTSHSYKAYQIFKGTQEDNSVPLGDVEWGTGINSDAFLAALKGDSRIGSIFASCSTAADVAAVLGATDTNGALLYPDKSDVANAFANVAAAHLTDTFTTIAAGANNVDLSAGYYLLVDAGAVTGNDAYNSALLQVTNKGDITIEKKYSVPAVDKGIVNGDSLVEADDVHIGDDVTFRLTGTLPSNYADYETYFYQFNDKLSNGLKYNGDAKVYVVNNGVKTEITGSFTIDPASAATTGGGTLTVTCNNLKAIASVTKDSSIVVEYTAELTSAAEIGQPGNDNTVTLKYSNNPNYHEAGTPPTGETPEDKVLVFTYELDVTKIDGQDPSKKLKDAEFVLLNSDKNKVAKVADGKFVEWVDVSNVTVNSDGTYPADYTLKSATTTGFFSIAGLDAGTYYLKETKAPAGYNLLKDPIKIVITATLDNSEDNPALKGLTISVDDGTAQNGNLDTGVVATDVKNNSGATLPETGGMGTTLFYVLGGVLVVGAVVLLVTKKRMSAEK